MTLSSGTLSGAADGALGSGPVTMNPPSGTAVLALTSGSPAISSLTSSGTGASVVVLGNATAGTPTTLTLGGNNSSAVFGGTIGDLAASNSNAAGGLIKAGSGTLTLNAADSYTGGTLLNGGALALGNASALGSGTLAMNGGTLQMAGGGTVPNNIQINAAAGNSFNTASYNMTLGGNLTGTGTVTKLGGNTVWLNGTDSGFSGTYVNNQSNTLFGSTAAGSPNALWTVNAGNLANNVASGGTISLGGLSGSGGQVGNNQSSSLVTYSIGAAGINSTYSGTIVNAAGAGGQTAIIKTGSGMLTLQGNNTYTGATTVSGGTLTLDSSTSTQTYNYQDGNVFINNGATFCVNAAGYKFGGTTFAFGNNGGGTFYLEGSGIGGGVSVLPAGITIATTGGAQDAIAGPMQINTAAQAPPP